MGSVTRYLTTVELVPEISVMLKLFYFCLGILTLINLNYCALVFQFRGISQSEHPPVTVGFLPKVINPFFPHMGLQLCCSL